MFRNRLASQASPHRTNRLRPTKLCPNQGERKAMFIVSIPRDTLIPKSPFPIRRSVSDDACYFPVAFYSSLQWLMLSSLGYIPWVWRSFFPLAPFILCGVSFLRPYFLVIPGCIPAFTAFSGNNRSWNSFSHSSSRLTSHAFPACSRRGMLWCFLFNAFACAGLMG